MNLTVAIVSVCLLSGFLFAMQPSAATARAVDGSGIYEIKHETSRVVEANILIIGGGMSLSLTSDNPYKDFERQYATLTEVFSSYGLKPQSLKSELREFKEIDGRVDIVAYFRFQIEVGPDNGYFIDAIQRATNFEVWDIEYDSSHRAQIERELKQLAVNEAIEQFQSTAGGVGLSVGRVLSIVEPDFARSSFLDDAEIIQVDSETMLHTLPQVIEAPLEPGEIKISSDIRVTIELVEP